MNYEVLNVFDFDGTLLNTPADSHDNRKKFEKATGIPWIINKDMARTLTKKLKRPINMRSGWWGRPESLEPPLVPDPTPLELMLPSTADFINAEKDKNAYTILMTGRHAGIQSSVLRILSDCKLLEVEKTFSEKGKVFYKNIDSIPVYFLGMNGPLTPDLFEKTKPEKTLPWKCWMIEQHLVLYPSIQKVKIWEDRSEHVEGFKQFATEYKNISFEVKHV